MNTRTRLPPPAIIVALSALLYAPFLFGGKVLYWGVYLLQFYPWRKLAVEQIRAGQWPLWNAYLGAGTPLAANMQTAAFYPPNVLFLLMPVEHAFGWSLALHVALAGLGTYYLGRTLGLKRFGALIAGLSFGFGGYIVARWVFPSMVCAAAWLPLMLAFANRLLPACAHPQAQAPAAKEGYHAGIALLLAITIALQLLAGHAQTSFYSLLILGAFATYRLVPCLANARTGDGRQAGAGEAARRGLAYMARIAGPAVAAIGLAAIQLLPTAELAAHSQRAGTLTDLRFAFELSFWPWRVISLLAPDFFGNPARGGYWAYGTYWEEAAYVGVLPLILATLALVAWWHGRGGRRRTATALVPFLAGLGLVSFVLALGEHTPIYPLLFQHAPGFGLFQAPARLMIGYALAVALLAGIGADALPLTLRVRGALRILLVLGLGMALAAGAALVAVPAVRATFPRSVVRLGLTLSVSAGLLLPGSQRLLRSQWFRGRLWQAAVAALVAADLFAFGWGLAPGTEPSVYHTQVESAGFLQAQPPGRLWVDPAYFRDIYEEYVSPRSFGSARPEDLRGLLESLIPNLNAAHHLPGLGNYDPLTVGVYQDVYKLLEASPEGVRAAANVARIFAARYVLSDRTMEMPAIYGGGPRIYLHGDALPEAFVVYRARVIEADAARLAALQSPSFDPEAEVLLSQAPEAALALPGEEGGTGPGSSAAVALQREGSGRVVVDVDTPRAGYLVLADTFYPGWQASVDGQAAEILAANHAFRAVPVPAGQHVVVFQYEPLSFRVGAWATAGSFALLSMVALSIGLRRAIGSRRRPPIDRPPTLA